MIMRRRFRLIFLVVATVAVLPHQQAMASGSLLAASCSGCHQADTDDEADNGNTDNLPTLGGRSRQQLLDALLAYRDGSRKGTLMQRIARGYSAAELDAIAEYLALKE